MSARAKKPKTSPAESSPAKQRAAREVPLELLTTSTDPDSLGFETTEELGAPTNTIGQDRAISALELGLGIDTPGYNVYVAGPTGTGRNTVVDLHLREIAIYKPVPPDWGYVHNFTNPAEPLCISLPCGWMRQLADDLDELVDGCRQHIPEAFDSEDYSHRVEDVVKGIGVKRQALTGEIEKTALDRGFGITTSQIGISPVPLVENRPITQEEFAALSDDAKAVLKESADELQHEIARMLIAMRRLNKEAQERTKGVDAEVVAFALKPIVEDLQEKYAAHPEVVAHLGRVEADMIAHLDHFKPSTEAAGPQVTGPEGDHFLKYRLNVLVDNSGTEGAPVVLEYSPTYYNLFGRIEYRARFGTLATDLTMIRPGALHRANGGYLVVQARDLFSAPLAWETLKRSLRSNEIRIENIGEQYSPLPSATLTPQPIPINVKLIIVGSADVLRALQAHDEDFARYFKVSADFDTVMERTEDNVRQVAEFVSARGRHKNLRFFDKTAVAILLDHSSRLVEHQGKLTTRFMTISDVMTEADHWAKQDASAIVTGHHVTKALQQRRYRSALTEDRLAEMIDDGTIHISTEGAVAGQVNGLAVLSTGSHTFGKPSRITARVSVGRGQVTNIERETKLSGRIHDKGFQILKGYVNGKYGTEKPLSLSASIGFEQTYSKVDGDSASSTEIYALLSELSGAPIDQGIAVTGSVNQAGEVQAIGGASLKIEGFFDVCVARGLTGTQGVMIPSDNVKNLVLHERVVTAVKDGKFHIYAVSHIDEGIEVLTGVPAGQQGEDGLYPADSIHARVEERLVQMARTAKRFAKTLNDELKAKNGNGEAEDEEKEAES
jgi:lon-related putative ATP-dependent protease